MTTDNLEQAKAECLQKLKRCRGIGDTDRAHIDADRALCELLEAIGLGEVAESFGKVDKWYGV